MKKKIINSEVIKEINMIFNFPKKPYFRRNLELSGQSNLAHYIFPDGECKTAQKPHDIETNIISVNLKGKNGEDFTYELKLPFSIINLRGSTSLIDSNHLERRFKKFGKELQDYIDKLAENPSIDMDFFNFITKNEIIFDRKNNKIIPKLGKSSPLNISNEDSKITISLDDEALTKLFFKIAWTHAVKMIGREKLTNNISEWIFTYITSGHIDDIDLISIYPDLFLEATKIGDEAYVFWKYNINRTLDIIQETVFRDDIFRIMKHYNYRYESYAYASSLIKISRIEVLDDEIRKNADHYRYHELSLESKIEDGLDATVCIVKLYGGILQAEVILSEKPISIGNLQTVRIEI